MLTIKDLSVEYADKKRAVNNVSFKIAPGKNVALIGANGAGKTTLLLALMGVLPIKTGEIFIDGFALNKINLQLFRTRMGLIFQNPDDQLFMPNIFEDVAFGLRNFGYDTQQVEERVESALLLLKISHLSKRSPLKLSGGEKRLAAIATVLSMQPDFLLFDEPTAFLDPKARRNLCGIINNLPQGKLIATHDLSFVEKTCSRVLILKDGEIVLDGEPDCLADEKLLEGYGL